MTRRIIRVNRHHINDSRLAYHSLRFPDIAARFRDSSAARPGEKDVSPENEPIEPNIRPVRRQKRPVSVINEGADDRISLQKQTTRDPGTRSQDERAYLLSALQRLSDAFPIAISPDFCDFPSVCAHAKFRSTCPPIHSRFLIREELLVAANACSPPDNDSAAGY